MRHKRRPDDARHYFDNEPHWPAEDMRGFRWVAYVIAIIWIVAALLCVALVVAVIWLAISLALTIGG